MPSTGSQRAQDPLRHLYGILLVALLALNLAGCDQGEQSDRVVIRFPHVTAPGTPKGRGADAFRTLVAERLGDQVSVEVFPSAQLMNDDDSLDALMFGEVQMIAISLSKLDRLTHDFQVFDLPFLFDDLEQVKRFQASDVGQELLATLSDKGILGLAYWHNGMKQFGGPHALRTPADGAGLNFRIQESDVLQAQVLAFGGIPQKMALAEVYQALQTGAIDAQENTWSNNYSQKFFEVQPVFTETRHGYLGYLVAVNQEFWNGLPAEVRNELNAALAEVTVQVNREAESINQSAREQIEASGQSQIVGLTEAELEEWRNTMRPVWTEFEGLIAPGIVDAARGSASAAEGR